MKLELGKVTAHPIIFGFRQFIGVMKTWRHCRKHNIQCREWYGIYEKGTENVVAQFGNMPNAENRAKACIKAIMEGEG